MPGTLPRLLSHPRGILLDMPAVPLSELRNLGPVTAARLAEVGVPDAEALERVGAVAAYQRLRDRWPRETSLVALYALEGALLDLPWNDLPRDVVARLRAAVGR